MHGKLAEADVGAAASDFGWPDLTGKGGGGSAIETAGRCRRSWSPGSAEGRRSISRTARSPGSIWRRPCAAASAGRWIVAKDMRSGGTAFDRASLDVTIDKGVARLARGELRRAALRANLEGVADLVAQSLRLRLEAAQTESTGSAPPGAARLGLDIEGPWASLTIEAIEETDATDPIRRRRSRCADRIWRKAGHA